MVGEGGGGLVSREEGWGPGREEVRGAQGRGSGDGQAL